MGAELLWLDGVAVHVSGRGPGLVLLHANGGDHRDFEGVIPVLTRTHTVYAIDWPSHGTSDPISHPTACGFADLLPRILERLGPGPFILMGNSVGGFAAVRVAIERPDLVSRLILINPGGFTPRTLMSRGVCRLLGSEHISPVAMRWLPRLYLRRSSQVVAAIRARATDASHSPARVRAFGSLWRSFADPAHDARRGLVRLTAPTLLIWGTRDLILPWLIDGQRAATAIPGATVKTFSCGHQAFAEMPEAFLAAVDDFLNQPDAA
jgi:pimeloyl-ACP methyl ester carboxylesterase